MQWTTKDQENLEIEENRIVHLYHEYMYLSDEDKVTLNAQWNAYFQEVREKSPYFVLFQWTKTYFSLSPERLAEERAKVDAERARLKTSYIPIRKPSAEDPQFLIMKYGQIMHKRNLTQFLEEKKSKTTHESKTVKNVRSVFGMND